MDGAYGHRSRIDYLLCKLAESDCVEDYVVNWEIELGDSEREDHNVVWATFGLPAALGKDLPKTARHGGDWRPCPKNKLDSGTS